MKLKILFACMLADAGWADDLQKSFVSNYAEILHAGYLDSHEGVAVIQTKIVALAERPTPAALAEAKQAWIDARIPYSQTEVARFYGGPIDHPDTGREGMINAWPLDEAYLDGVEGMPDAGIINDRSIEITAERLRAMNEVDGETNISTGFHAIEFLLWGQDFHDDGPGRRPIEDFTTNANADRRLQALKVLAAMLVEDVKSLVDAWAPGGGNYREEFLEMPTGESMGLIVNGMGAMLGGELAGERLSVAYDTKGQEDEHSCFSDTTHLDALYNMTGIRNVYAGRYVRPDGSVISGTGLHDVIKTGNPAAAVALLAEMDAALEAVKTIPVPFDQAILGSDEAVGRVAMKQAIDRLQKAADSLAQAIAEAGITAGGGGDAVELEKLGSGLAGWLLILVLLGSSRTRAQVTTDDRTRQAFGQPVAGLDADERRMFFVGNSFFNSNWVVAPASTSTRDGLGPLFNMRSCSSCHLRDGRGELPEAGVPLRTALVRLGVPGRDGRGQVLPEPAYGSQFQGMANAGVVPEGDAWVDFETVVEYFKDGTSIELRKPVIRFSNLGYGPMSEEVLTSLRVAPAIHGSGLLAAIPEEAIVARADPDDLDGDGISGRVNRVWDERRGESRLGRLGWKANQPDLTQQVAEAFLNDIGITSPVFPNENLSSIQADAHRELPDGGEPEISQELLDAVVFYCQTLAVPNPRNQADPQVVRGSQVFKVARCNACHVEEWTTSATAFPAALAGQRIRPYTDLLLHDMGPVLADGRPDFEANGSEWRTPPLWGLGLHQTVNGRVNFLHDGRARTPLEAVMWHGGEAEASREYVRGLDAADRAALEAFLNSL
jgi:CxxC motif-containing protein (DUF1111 family)/uncharacterized iron-regulated protein